MLAVVAEGFALGGVDDQRPGVAELLLQAGVAVVPVGAVLAHREAVGEGLAGGDAGEADAGHAILVGRQDQAMPVDGRRLIEQVGHPEYGILALLEADHRPGALAVDGVGPRRLTIDLKRRATDGQRHLRAFLDPLGVGIGLPPGVCPGRA